MLLFLLIAFHIFGNVLWITLNNVPPTWDAALHTILSLRFLEYLQNHLTSFNLVDFLKITDYYPPFVHWIGSALALIGQNDWKTIQLSGTIFFAIAIFFIYRLAGELFKNNSAALFSATFFSFFITVYQQSRDHMLDVPLTSLYLVGLYFLVKSECFQKPKATLAFFISLALAFLTKWYALVYFAIPVLFAGIQMLRQRQLPIKNLLVGTGLFLLIGAPWYLVNLQKFLEIAKITSTPELADPQNLFSVQNLVFHLWLIIEFQTTMLGFLFFLFSSYLLVRLKPDRQAAWLIFTVIVFNYLFFTFIPNKNIRYLVPLMPFLALVMGYGASKLPKIATIAFVAYFILTYLILSFAVPFYPKYKASLPLPLLSNTDFFYLHTYPVRVLYQNTTFSYEELVGDIAKTKSSGQIKILLLKDTPNINNGILDPRFYKATTGRVDDFYYLGYDLLLGKDSDLQIAEFLSKNVDIAVVSTNYLGLGEAIREFDTVEKYRQYFLSGKARNFVLTKEYNLPADDFSPADRLLLYQKRGN